MASTTQTVTPPRIVAWLPERYRGAPLIALSCIFFALMAVGVRTLAGELATGQIVLIRFLVGLVFLGVMFGATGTRPRFTRTGLWALRGILGGAAVYLYFIAIEQIAVGPATLLNYTSPVFAALFASSFLRERLSANVLAGVLVATVGAALVIWSTVDLRQPFVFGIGVWAGIASAVCGGGAMTVIKALRHDTDSATVFFSFCLFGALIAAPLAALDWRPISPNALFIAFLVGLASAVAQMLFTYAFAFTSAASGSAATQLTPAFSWVLGVALLDEHTSLLAIVGAVICVAGVILGAAGRWKVGGR